MRLPFAVVGYFTITLSFNGMAIAKFIVRSSETRSCEAHSCKSLSCKSLSYELRNYHLVYIRGLKKSTYSTIDGESTDGLKSNN